MDLFSQIKDIPNILSRGIYNFGNLGKIRKICKKFSSQQLICTL